VCGLRPHLLRIVRLLQRHSQFIVRSSLVVFASPRMFSFVLGLTRFLPQRRHAQPFLHCSRPPHPHPWTRPSPSRVIPCADVDPWSHSWTDREVSHLFFPPLSSTPKLTFRFFSIIALVFTLITTVFFVFPPDLPVSGSSMKCVPSPLLRSPPLRSPSLPFFLPSSSYCPLPLLEPLN
jgi:hypothetical protein